MQTTKPKNVQRLIDRLRRLPNGATAGIENDLMAKWEQKHSDCGTVGCIAGEVLLEFSPGYPSALGRYRLPFVEHNLGLTMPQTLDLCFLDRWPDKLRAEFRRAARAKTLKSQRNVMIKRLELLLED
jgi:hypothetical protein